MTLVNRCLRCGQKPFKEMLKSINGALEYRENGKSVKYVKPTQLDSMKGRETEAKYYGETVHSAESQQRHSRKKKSMEDSADKQLS